MASRIANAKIQIHAGNVAQLAPNFKYNSVPATSGPHSSQTVIYGVYDQPVSEINYVHNLEHGAIGIQYGEKVPQATVERIIEYYNADPAGLVVAPNPALGDQIGRASCRERVSLNV